MHSLRSLTQIKSKIKHFENPKRQQVPAQNFGNSRKQRLLANSFAPFERPKQGEKIDKKQATPEQARIRECIRTSPGNVLEMLAEMQRSSNPPTAETYCQALCHCMDTAQFELGKKIHCFIKDQSFPITYELSLSLLSLYSKCGDLVAARKIFDDQLKSNEATAISFNMMMQAYTNYRHPKTALELFNTMKSCNVKPNVGTYLLVLSACIYSRQFDLGKQIYSEIPSMNIPLLLPLQNSAINLYSKSGDLIAARKMFDSMVQANQTNVVTWGTMMSGYTKQGQPKEALELFNAMKAKKIAPNAVVYCTVLSACSSSAQFALGKQIIQEIKDQQIPGTVLLNNSMLSLYSKCDLVAARQLFEELVQTGQINFLSWSIMISGYTKHGKPKKALELFNAMKAKHITPNSQVYAAILSACALSSQFDLGKQITQEIQAQKLPPSLEVINSTINLYSKFDLITARQLFDDALQQKQTDVVSWVIMISGYIESGKPDEALELFNTMKASDVRLDLICYPVLLSKCINSSQFDLGKKFHQEIQAQQIPLSVPLQKTIRNLYAKAFKSSTA